MIDLKSETVLSLTAAAGRFPSTRQGKPVHVATIYRYGRRGIRGVRLEMVRLGGRWVTSAEAIDRFSAALTSGFAEQGGTADPGRDHDGPRPATVGPTRPSRSSMSADRELARLGV